MNTHGRDPARPGASASRTVRRFTFAFAVGSCVASVGCVRQPDAKSCPTGIYCPAGTDCAARQQVCIRTPCGNGRLDPGEVCDDGNILDGDGCNATCTSNETCGNGVKDVNEECDYGLTPDTCTTSCRSNVCGNDRPDPGEDCDPGSAGMTAQCLPTCKWSRHGDGWVNPLDGEQCDGDGLGNVTVGIYGDACEFAGTVAGTYRVCNSDCTLGSHGDGKVNRSDGELCDGLSDGVPTGRSDCESKTCNSNCTPSSCGDGVTNPTAGEACDDGNKDNQDDCTNACTANVCGDGIPQLGGSRVEECDRGGANVASIAGRTCGYGQTCTFCLQVSCTEATVVGPRCGDGVVQGSHGEKCDDARSAACGTCDASCQRVWPRPAQGSFDVVNAASIVAGDTITIDDGASQAVLEFSDSLGRCTTTGVRCVDMQPATDNGAAAAQIRTAMSAVNGWTSKVAPSGTGNPVSLVQARAGVSYNIAIAVHGSSVAVSPADGAAVVHGMSGGVGCLAGDACASSNDCVWPLSCSNNGVCQ
jgi:cysteine-rich repeat protein